MAGLTGVYGGMFDPPHLGHVALAQEAVRAFALARLLVRVVGAPGHRAVATPAEDRLALARLAFADVPGAETALDPHARTVDSLEALALDEPIFLVGADEFAGFLSWKEPARVLELARLGVAMRPGVGREALDAVLVRLDRPDRVVFFPIPPHDVSSSDLRARLRRGEPVDGLVPPAVAAEIRARGLYRGELPSAGPGYASRGGTRKDMKPS